MFCPNCGEKIDNQNQKFCTSCGSEIPFISEILPLKAERSQIPSANIQQKTPVYQSKSVKTGRPGQNSIMCIVFAVTSIVLAVIGFNVGGFNFFRYFIPLDIFPYFSSGLVGWIIALILNIVGIVLGILSRIFGGKAEDLEPPNILEKFGSIISVFGIIINGISLVIMSISLSFFLGIF